jgi:ABC-type sulfate transport system permease component
MSSSFRILLSLIAGIFFGFIAIIITCLLTATSFAEFAGEIRSPEIISAILLSLKTSIAVVLLALLFGIQLFVASPFLIRAAKTAFESIDQDVVDAARTLGASEFYAFRKVSLPLARSGIASGVVMTWARALGEFGATAMVAGCIPYRTETMTVGIYMHAMSGDISASVALSLILMSLAFTTLIVFKYLGTIGDGNLRTRETAAQ